jgi:hypothetical protein
MKTKFRKAKNYINLVSSVDVDRTVFVKTEEEKKLLKEMKQKAREKIGYTLRMQF